MEPPPLTRILLVEDDEDIQLVIRLALEKDGPFELLICGSGEEALAKAPGFSPQLILLDVVLPGQSGLETLAGLRQIPSSVHAPVIFVTARGQPAEVERYWAAGAAEVIIKPFDPLGLADWVRDVWQRHSVAADRRDG